MDDPRLLDEAKIMLRRIAENEPAAIMPKHARAILDAMPEGPGLTTEIRDALDALPDGTWETWTSCSFRRITRAETSHDGDVLHATKHSHDGHPDLSWTEAQCRAICTVVNGLRILPTNSGWIDAGIAEAECSFLTVDLTDLPVVPDDTYRVMVHPVEGAE